MKIKVADTEVIGVSMDKQTRCQHYATAEDVIAIKFYCCNAYYPCHLCHEELAGHTAIGWPRSEYGKKAILCGVCGHSMSISQYMACHAVCPNCNARFNPGCEHHYHLYFSENDANDK